jgi:hypothetical protein
MESAPRKRHTGGRQCATGSRQGAVIRKFMRNESPARGAHPSRVQVRASRPNPPNRPRRDAGGSTRDACAPRTRQSTTRESTNQGIHEPGHEPGNPRPGYPGTGIHEPGIHEFGDAPPDPRTGGRWRITPSRLSAGRLSDPAGCRAPCNDSAGPAGRHHRFSGRSRPRARHVRAARLSPRRHPRQ